MRDFQPELKTYTMDEIPSDYEHQIRSFTRLHWSDGYQYSLTPTLGNPKFQPLHFVLVEEEALYSAARVNRKTIQHQGQHYVTYGLGGVLTYPAFRKRGFGAWVVKEATEYIHEQANADIAILWTSTDNISFYERAGWEHTPNIKLMVGDPDNPHQSEGEVLMCFISETAQTDRHQFIENSVYFGKYAW